jgi:hypothetical protein
MSDNSRAAAQLPKHKRLLRGLPTRAKIEELHRYWFDTGHPLVVEFDG